LAINSSSLYRKESFDYMRGLSWSDE